MNKYPPKILIIGGHDPTGGAGIQADIETLTNLNCHAVCLISCLTSQSTSKFKKSYPINSQIFREQSELLLSDVEINAVKIGAIGSAEIANEIIRILKKLKRKQKVIIDPIIRPSMGGTLADQKLIKKIKEEIFPFSYLITPNLEEAYILNDKISKEELIIKPNLIAENILLKDCMPLSNKIINKLYSSKKLTKEWALNRVDGNYHGTGCTLASAITGLLAKKKSLEQSIEDAQSFTHESIKNAFPLGKGQKILKRLLI